MYLAFRVARTMGVAVQSIAVLSKHDRRYVLPSAYPPNNSDLAATGPSNAASVAPQELMHHHLLTLRT